MDWAVAAVARVRRIAARISARAWEHYSGAGLVPTGLQRAGGEGYAGDLGVVVEEGQVLPGAVGWLFEEGFEGVELAEAELEGEEASGLEGGVGGGEEAAVDVEAVGAGEEGGVGFVLEDFVGHGGGFVEGDVGRVGDDDVEGSEGLDQGRGEEVGLEEGDAVGEVVAGGVLLGNGERRGVEVGGGDAGGGEFGGEGEGDGAGAGADVEDVGIAEVCGGWRPSGGRLRRAVRFRGGG